MKISLVLAATLTVIQFGKKDINGEVKMAERHLRISLFDHGFSGTKQALMKKLRSSKQEPKEISKKHEEMETKERIDNIKVDNFVSKAIPEVNSRGMMWRQPREILKDVVNGSRIKRQVLKSAGIWRNGVPYMISTSDEDVRKIFIMAAKVWNDLTCVDFVEDNTAEDKVVVISAGGTWSSAIGRIGGVQYVSLEGYESLGSAVHEIGHVLGLLHTMQRYDRDSYVEIQWENIDKYNPVDFGKASENETDVYGLMYDYGSIMHYDENSGSATDKITMIAVNPHYQKTMGSDIISFSDIFAVNMRYGCNERCNQSTSAKCVNDGFPHPRNCSMCICPSGYGGDLCDRRPPGCGQNLVAKSKIQTVNCRLGHGFNLRDLFDFCNYMIRAPGGKKIEVEAQIDSDGFELPGCPFGGIEIKAQKDQKMTGYRFCTRNGTEIPIVSSHSHLPLTLYSRYATMKVKFRYRSVD